MKHRHAVWTKGCTFEQNQSQIICMLGTMAAILGWSLDQAVCFAYGLLRRTITCCQRRPWRRLGQRLFWMHIPAMLAVYVFFISFLLIAAAPSYAETLILHPSGISTGDETTAYLPLGQTAVTACDSNDGNLSYARLRNNTLNSETRLELDDTTQTGLILSVQIKVVISDEEMITTDQIRIGIKTNTLEYWANPIGNIIASPSYETRVGQLYTTNPNTGAAWTWSQVNSLVGMVDNYLDSSDFRITELYAEVTYSTDLTAPAAITDLSQGAVTANSIVLTWTAPGDDGTTGTAAAYDLRYRTDAAITPANWDSATQVVGELPPAANGILQAFGVPNLSPNTTYSFAIKTEDEAHNWSELSNVLTASIDTFAPVAINNLAAGSVTGNSVNLTWTAPGDDGTIGRASTYDIRYRTDTPINAANWASALQVAGEPQPDIANTAQSFMVSNLLGNTTYYFAIETADEASNWSMISNIVIVNTLDADPPAPIADLAIGAVAPNSIVLSWTAPGDDLTTGTATTYDIRYRTDAPVTSSNWADATQVAGEIPPAVAGTGQAFNVTGLNPDTTYYFAIETGDEVPNWSAVSNGQSAKTTDNIAPASVMNLAPSAVLETSVKLTWTAPGDNGTTGTANRYDIRYLANTPITSANWASANQATGEPAPTAAGNAQSFTVSNLSSNTTYYFAIQTADEASNWSPISPNATATTLPIDVTAPARITNLAVAAGSVTGSGLQLTWTSPGDDGTTGTATSYDIRYRTGGPVDDTNWANATLITNEPAPLIANTPQSLQVINLNSDTTYYFAIKTVDEANNTSLISTPPLQVKTLDITPPAAITLATSNPTSYSITLSWTTPGDNGTTGIAASYDIRFRTGSPVTEANWASASQVAGEPAPLAAGNSQTYEVTGLSANTSYYFAIKTADEVFNWSPISISQIGTTLPDTTAPDPVVLSTGTVTYDKVELKWTSPGDDRAIGTAFAYDIRYRTDTAINSDNWATSNEVTGEPAPRVAGTSQAFNVTGLNPDTTYYFAIKTSDEVPNWSVLSSSITVVTLSNVAADFSGTPTSGGWPLTVNFTDKSTGGANSWAWDFNNDGTVDSIAKNPSYIYAAAGTYTVKLTATGSGGPSSVTKANYVTVVDPPIADFSGTATPPLYRPLTMNFTDQSTGGTVTSWAWDFNNDGITDSTVKNPSYTYQFNGIYSVKLTVTGPGGSNSKTRVDYVTVSEPPIVADFTALPQTGLPPLAVTFTDKSTGLITLREWDFQNDGVVDSNDPQPVYTYAAAGSYTVKLKVSGLAGSDSMVKVNHIVVGTSQQVPIPDFIALPTTGLMPLTVTFTDKSTGATSWAWDFQNDGIVDAMVQNPVYTFSQAGTYSVSLYVEGPGGSGTKIKEGYINVTVSSPVPDFVANPVKGSAPLTVNFTDLSAGEISSREWDFDNNGTVDSTDLKPVYTYNALGKYTVKLTVKGPGGTKSEIKFNYIDVTDSKPTANFGVTSPTTGNCPLKVSFMDSSTGLIDSWAWDFDGDGTVDSKDKNPVYEFFRPGVYTVSLTVTGPAGSNTMTKPEYITSIDVAKDWYVDAGKASGDGTTWSKAFKSIPEAISAAKAGDRIHVAGGVYEQKIIVDKSLSILGEGPGLVIYRPSNSPEIDKPDLAIRARQTLIEGFVLDFNGPSPNDNRSGNGIGIIAEPQESQAVTDVVIRQNTIYSGHGDVAIWNGAGLDLGGLMIIGNTIYADEDAGGKGVSISGHTGARDVIIAGNEFYGKLTAGVTVDSSNVQVLDNIFSGTKSYGVGVRLTDMTGGLTRSGIIVSGNKIQVFDVGISAGTSQDLASSMSADINFNTLTKNNTGIDLGYGTNMDISYNTISGNDLIGAKGLVRVSLAANYWGDPAGPKVSDTGSKGDRVDSNIDYSPWLGLLPDRSPMTFYTNDSIKDALKMASDRDSINVLPGTYDEQLTINSKVSLKALGANNSVIVSPTVAPAAGVYDLFVAASGSVIDGFMFDFNGSGQSRAGNGIAVGMPNSAPVTDVKIQNCLVETGHGMAGITTGQNTDVSGLLVAGSHFEVDHDSSGVGIKVNSNLGNGNITVRNNSFDGFVNIGISVESSNVLISGNTLNSGVAFGNYGVLYADSLNRQTFSNVEIRDNKIERFKTAIGVGNNVAGAKLAARIDHNTLSGNLIGIQAFYGSDLTIVNNNITSNTSYGISCESPGISMLAESNIISGNNVGLRIGYSNSNITVFRNEIYGNTVRGVANDDASNLLNAKGNWWGSNSVPGTSDVSANVTHAPSVHVWFVDAGIATSGTGTSWATAFKTIQEAVAAANVNSSDWIWVKAGSYLLSSQIDLSKPVSIYGGFAGNETSRNQRDWVANRTIVDGQNRTRCFYLTADVLIDGLTITRGVKVGPLANGQGGGIFSDANNSKIVNCTFYHNQAIQGGALFIEEAEASISIIGCSFTQNTAVFGGAIYSFEGAKLFVSGSRFSENTAGQSGGAICNQYGTYAVLTNSIIYKNTAGYDGGAVYNYEYAACEIVNCTITANTASNAGGAVMTIKSDAFIANSIVWGNKADFGSEIYNGGSVITLGFNNIKGGVAGIANENNGTIIDNGGNVAGDPQLVADLHIKAGSICVDNGDPGVAPSQDFDGEPRPSAKGYDIGADEFYDSDKDFIPDYWERKFGLNVSNLMDAIDNPDNDGLINKDEFQNNTDPHVADTDGDGISDGDEVADGTNPTDPLDYSIGNGRVFLVDWATGKDSNPGRNWVSAKQTIQAAIDACSAAGGGGAIWVKSGIYKPGTTRKDSIRLAEKVILYGGFTGTETDVSQRDWVKNPTILSGDIGIPGNIGDNVYHVLIGANDAKLDGFIISDGNASGSTPDDSGGGIYSMSSAPSLVNCSFEKNSAINKGGAIYNESAKMQIDKCKFSDNNAAYGGAIYNSSCSPMITHTLFKNNRATIRGGAVVNYNYKPIILDSIFWGNNAAYGGALFSQYDQGLVTNCVFYANTASDRGGAISGTSSKTLVVNSILWGNTAAAGPDVSQTYNMSSGGEQLPVAYSDINQAGYEGVNGNIRKDPLFILPDRGDFHLQSISPCVDAGTADLSGLVGLAGSLGQLTLSSVDVDGEKRNTDGNNDGVDAPDLGIDESAPPVVWFVNGGVTASGNGTSWATAFKTIQEGINASANRPYEQVRVMKGNYPITSPIIVDKAVTVTGGYNGNEQTSSDRKWRENVTTVDGQDIAPHCFMISADGAGLNGFTIKRGNAAGTDGGGIYNNADSVIANCVLANNKANNGGGIYNDSALATIVNNVFYGNTAAYGGAIYDSAAATAITSCTIFGNAATSEGGAIFLNNAPSVISNSILWGNISPVGSEISVAVGSAPPIVQNCDIDQDGYAGHLGNINQDPLFKDEAAFDFHLQPFSPCIDAGIADAPGLRRTDFEGDPRVSDGDNKGGASPDIGVDELPQSSIWYVDAKWRGTGGITSDGKSWQTAFKTIQEAVASAGATTHDWVWVKGGTYHLPSPIKVDKPISFFGGFDGTETDLSARNWVKNQTIVDGLSSDGLSRVSHCFELSADVAIDGFVITGGYASGHESQVNGGGIIAYGNCEVQVVNTKIKGNNAISVGGGIYLDGARLRVVNSIVASNGAGLGGGIGNIGGGSASIISSTIVGNSAASSGGGIYNESEMLIVNTILWDNVSISNTSTQIQDAGNGSTSVTYSDVDQDGYLDSGGSAKRYNIRSAPQFVKPKDVNTDYDYHLQSSSPCIDAGNNSPDTEPLRVTDFDNQYRQLDGNGDGVVTTDMGAFEYLQNAYILSLAPLAGGYGTTITIKGRGLGTAAGMSAGQNGYRRVVLLEGNSGTYVVTSYSSWINTKVVFSVKALFKDLDGDYYWDNNEPFAGQGQIELGNYKIRICTIHFQDVSGNRIFDNEDIVTSVEIGNPVTFKLTGAPVIFQLEPMETYASQPGAIRSVSLVGVGFGNSQGTSILHLGSRSFVPGDPSITSWSNDRITFNMPSTCSKLTNVTKKSVWVKVNGLSSNRKPLRVVNPPICR